MVKIDKKHTERHVKKLIGLAEMINKYIEDEPLMQRITLRIYDELYEINQPYIKAHIKTTKNKSNEKNKKKNTKKS